MSTTVTEKFVELRGTPKFRSTPINASSSTSQESTMCERYIPHSNLAADTRRKSSVAVGPTRRRRALSSGWQRVRLQNTRLKSICECHDKDYAPWTGEIHGLSQALQSKSLPLRVFWWVVLVMCIVCGSITTVLVIKEYLNGPTATSTTIRLVPTLELPAITVCPKVPDAFNFEEMYVDMRTLLPRISREVALDLVRFWLGGSGLQNMAELAEFNRSYITHMTSLYAKWANGYDIHTFFDVMQMKYGYKCSDLFHYCELGGRQRDCCRSLFTQRSVMRRGICYQTRRGINQTEADDIGRLVLSIKQPNSITSPIYNYIQPQILIYVNDNFDDILDFPRYYLYPYEWNRMHFSARLVELLETHPDDCTNELIGKDAKCFVRNWLNSNIVHPFNCTVPYLNVDGNSSKIPICQPQVIARNYQHSVQVVHAGSLRRQTNKCIPGCKRWEYSVSLQQSPSLAPFVGHVFNLEASFYDLQYEHVKEVYTVSTSGFMSQIGGQFGFFLGLSIITVIQIAIHSISYLALQFYRLAGRAARAVYAMAVSFIRFCTGESFRQPSSANGDEVQNVSTRITGTENVAFAPTPPATTPTGTMGGVIDEKIMEIGCSKRFSMEPVVQKYGATSSETLDGSVRMSAAGAAAAAAYRKRAALFVTPSAASIASARSTPAQSAMTIAGTQKNTLTAWSSIDMC